MIDGIKVSIDTEVYDYFYKLFQYDLHSTTPSRFIRDIIGNIVIENANSKRLYIDIKMLEEALLKYGNDAIEYEIFADFPLPSQIE